MERIGHLGGPEPHGLEAGSVGPREVQGRVKNDDSAPLRIVLTIHHYLDLNTGAPGSTLQLGNALRRQGHQVSVVGFENLPIDLGTRLNQFAFPIYAAAHVRRLLSRGLVDVVDASTGDLSLLPRVTITKARAIVVTRSHGLEHLAHIEQLTPPSAVRCPCAAGTSSTTAVFDCPRWHGRCELLTSPYSTTRLSGNGPLTTFVFGLIVQRPHRMAWLPSLLVFRLATRTRFLE